MSLERLPEALGETGLVACDRDAPASYRPIGDPPDWFLQFWPVASEGVAPLAERSLFLADFVERIEPMFGRTADFVERSGVWAETAADGTEVHLEATAVRCGTAKHLLIQRQRGEFDFQRRVLQRARDQKLRAITGARHDADALRIRDLFVAALGHRLRNPLGVLSGALQLLDEASLEGHAAALRLAHEATYSMTTLTDTLLALEQAVLDAQSEPTGPVDAAEVVRTAHAGVSAEDSGRLKFQPGSRTVKVRARLEGAVRALRELITNALRHGPPDSTIHCGLEVGEGEVRLSVSDGGPRLTGALLERLFEPFAIRTDAGSSGVGLALAHALASGMGGRIEYSWESRGGSRFTLVLPLVR